MMSNREYRVNIAQQTLSILDQGYYHNGTDQIVSLAADLAFARNHSIHYNSASLEEMRCRVATPATPTTPSPAKMTRIEVNNESTLAAAHRLVANGWANPLCLNFASAKNPGGGFLGGAEAQEENLAKSSGLYPCIVQMSAMYADNRAGKTCLYNDDMIYSPKVPVFRDDAYHLLDAHYLASMVTAPAVNRGAVARNTPSLLDQVPAVMQTRIDKLLALALHHGHTCIILGAWGCGVFGNRPQEMASWFAQYLLEDPRYRQAFELISFAVLDTKNNGTFQAFHDLFSGKEST